MKATLALVHMLGATMLFAGCGARGFSVENATDCVVDVTVTTPPGFGFPMRSSGQVLKCIELAPGEVAKDWRVIESSANGSDEYTVKVIAHESGKVFTTSIPAEGARPNLQLHGTAREITFIWLNRH